MATIEQLHNYTNMYTYNRLWNEEFVRVRIPLSSLIRGDDIKRKKGMAWQVNCDRQTGIINMMPLSIKHMKLKKSLL